MRLASALLSIGLVMSLSCKGPRVGAPLERNAAGEAGAGGQPSTGGSEADPSSGGMADRGPSGGEAGGDACQPERLTLEQRKPVVWLVVEGSAGVFGGLFQEPPKAYDELGAALFGGDSALVADFADAIEFRMSIFHGPDDAESTCPITIRESTGDPAMLDSVYRAHYRPESAQVPTGDVIGQLNDEASVSTNGGGTHYVLFTEGNATSCAHPWPECGADHALAAVQRAFDAGISTWVVGLRGPSECVGRCGTDYLQDLANAGLGMPVRINTPTYLSSCELEGEGGGLEGRYVDMTTENAPVSELIYADDLRVATRRIFASIAACSRFLSPPARRVTDLDVFIADGAVAPGKPDGWSLDSDGSRLTLHGDACTALRSHGVEALRVFRKCEP